MQIMPNKPWPKSEQARERAKRNATDVAVLFNAKVSAKTISRNDPVVIYNVPLDSGNFRYTLTFSATNYSFTGYWKQFRNIKSFFSVSLGKPDQGGTTILNLNGIDYGYPIYFHDFGLDDNEQRFLRLKKFGTLLRKLDMKAARSGILNTLQIFVWSKFISPTHTVAQAKLFQKLLETSYYHSYKK